MRPLTIVPLGDFQTRGTVLVTVVSNDAVMGHGVSIVDLSQVARRYYFVLTLLSLLIQEAGVH